MRVTSSRLLAAARELGGGDGRRDAEVLLAHALGVNRAWLMAHGEDELPEEGVLRFEGMLARRAEHEPVAYIVGEREFWSLSLEVTPDVLIPRPETELLVELATARLKRSAAPRVADVGTGSGAIAIALAVELPGASVVATDTSGAALAVARRNVARHGLEDRVALREGDLLAPLVGLPAFDAIVSNPPYVSEGEYAGLMPGVREWEPREALVGGTDGLDAIRRLVAGAAAYLEVDGWLLFEHGAGQGAAAREVLARAGFRDVGTAQDLAGRDRVSFGTRPALTEASSRH